MKRFLLSLFVLSIAGLTVAQSVDIAGVVSDSETGRRIDRARIRVLLDGELISNYVTTGRNGNFSLQLPGEGEYALEVVRKGYYEQVVRLDTPTDGSSITANIPLERLPGYEFELLMRELIDAKVGKLGDTVSGVRVEIYDLTDAVVIQDSVLVEAGEEFTLARGHRYAFLLRRTGFFAKRFDVFVDVAGCILCFEGLGTNFEPNILESLRGGEDGGSGAVLADIPMRRIVVGEQVEIPNIYYDYNSAAIRSDAQPVVARLAQQLRATPVNVTLGSHTDSRGAAEYNQALSLRRAQSVVDYLSRRGVPDGRVTAKGFGESDLINDCADGVECTEAQHQENRRTTFTVTKLLQRSTFEDRTLQQLFEEERATNRRAVELLEEVPE